MLARMGLIPLGAVRFTLLGGLIRRGSGALGIWVGQVRPQVILRQKYRRGSSSR